MESQVFHQNQADGRGRPSRQPDLSAFPPAVLARHGARVLDPAKAVRASGTAAPEPTVYRYGTLLVPADQLSTEGNAALDRVLAPLGLRTVPPAALPSDPPALRSLPRPVGLAVTEGGPPSVVDAWAARQALIGAAGRGDLNSDLVSQISLEHLLVGSALAGPGTLVGAPNTATEGSPDRGGRSAGGWYPDPSGRVPVRVALPEPPHRHRLDQLGSRRPVVAVLDTGLGTHPWLDWADKAIDPVGDAFVVVDSALQAWLRQHAEAAAKVSGGPTAVILDFFDPPVSAEPLVGELSTHTGHGTFIAGIVRQVAPDAQVRAVRIMHPDGVVYEGDLLLALGLLTEEMDRARAGVPGAMPVDVVSLSLGYFDEQPGNFTSALAAALNELAVRGVVVAAAAGNYSTDRPFYPAGLAAQPGPGAPLLSVGALNPNGSVALFSDQGDWVHWWAPGAAVVSTFPPVTGSISPAVRPTTVGGAHRRETLDPDDFQGGFAIWSGTSFAAPVVAAEVAAALLAHGSASPSLADLSPTAMVARAHAAVARVAEDQK